MLSNRYLYSAINWKFFDQLDLKYFLSKMAESCMGQLLLTASKIASDRDQSLGER